MKPKLKQWIAIVCAALTAAITAMTAFAAGNAPESAELSPLSFLQTVAYINARSPDPAGEETIGYAYLLAEKMKDVDGGKIEETLLNPDNCDAARVAVMLVAADLGLPLNDEKVKSLLFDGCSCELLRAYALDYLSKQEPMDAALFAEIARDEADPQAAWALKLLSLSQPDAARPVLDEVLAAYRNGPVDSRTGTAFVYKASELREHGGGAETAMFLRQCEAVLAQLPALPAGAENDSRALVYYAVAEIGTPESVAYLFSLESVDSHYLWNAVQQARDGVVYELYDAADDKQTFAKKMRAANYPMLGDMDGDDVLTPEDARRILRQVLRLEPASREEEWDMDGDGRLTAADARMALRAAVGIGKRSFLNLPREPRSVLG